MGRSLEEWQTFVGDMQAFCTTVLDYAQGLERDQFIANRMVYDAILLNLILIGEAANYVSKSIQEGYPEIPWRRIIGMRNQLIHDYWDIDNDLTWYVIQNDVPALVTALQNLLEAEDHSAAQQ